MQRSRLISACAPSLVAFSLSGPACDARYWEDGSDGCETRVRALALDEPGDDGVRPLDLLSQAEGSSKVEMRWAGSGAGYAIEPGDPEAPVDPELPVELELGVLRAQAPGQWVERRGTGCTEPSQTEASVTVSLATEDGLLVGEVLGRAFGSGPVFVRAEGFEPSDFEGFEPVVVEPEGAQIDAMRLEMRTDEGVPVWGTIEALFFEAESVQVSAVVELATWNTGAADG